MEDWIIAVSFAALVAVIVTCAHAYSLSERKDALVEELTSRTQRDVSLKSQNVIYKHVYALSRIRDVVNPHSACTIYASACVASIGVTTPRYVTQFINELRDVSWRMRNLSVEDFYTIYNRTYSHAYRRSNRGTLYLADEWMDRQFATVCVAHALTQRCFGNDAYLSSVEELVRLYNQYYDSTLIEVRDYSDGYLVQQWQDLRPR